MSDDPFAEPGDSDRTIIRPAPGGRRAPASTTAPQRTARPSWPVAPEPPAPVAMGEGAETLAFGQSPLAVAAAPLLQLLARLRNAANPPDAGDLRERVVREVRAFEQRARDGGVPMELVRPAHYALCATIDDVVLNTPWGGAGDWQARALVATFHHGMTGGDRFFAVLEQMKQTPGTFLPVLELMYCCLALGFMGRHRQSPRGPADLDRAREDLYAVIARQRPPVSPDLSPRWLGLAAPFRRTRGAVPLWVGAAVALASVGAAYGWAATGLNAASDDLYARMLAAPPAAMPAIVRAAAIVPPPAPPSPEPTFLDRLRQFLKPDIDRGLVTVLGTPSTPVIRIRNHGMFASGAATLQPAIVPSLERIGTALKDQPGRIAVIGYTDNQPIRTVQFPSNFQLSGARAQAARAVLARAVGDPARVTAEGRADADPLAGNDTAEGREQNRRIEVILHRPD